MKLRTFAILIITAVATAQIAAAQTWSEYRPQGCRCQVSVPKTPVYGMKDVESDVGMLKMHQYMMDFGEYAFLLTYTDYPSTLLETKSNDKILDDVVKGSVGDGQLVRQTNLEIDGYPGKEYIGKKPDFTLKGRVFLVGQRLYQLITVYPPQQTDALSTDVEDFIRSFRLLH